MMYALLQRSLDQTITREAMEEASTAAPQVARGDCARLHRELFGLVVRRLDADNARAFQGALRRQGFETDLVPESELFVFPPAYRAQALRLTPDAVAFADVYGRERMQPLRTCVFAAAGRVRREREQRRDATELVVRDYGRYGRRIALAPVTRRSWGEIAQFRIECFFPTDPVRVEWVLEEHRVAKLNAQPVRLRDQDALAAFLADLQARLSTARVNRGCALFGAENEPCYPSLPAFEEEILWHFRRLRSERRGTGA